jgi:dienelactone hydrolase
MKPIARTVNLLAYLVAVNVFILSTGAAFAQSGGGAEASFQTTEVSFPTEDGWTIYGTLYMPKSSVTTPVPALVVLNEPGGPLLSQHIRQIGGNISRGVAQRIGMAALSIDVRGSGHSFGKKYFEEFSPEERDALQLDIRGAVAFLSAQKGIDRRRMAVMAPSITAEYAVREASHNLPQIKALVLTTGWFTTKSREYIESRSDLPILAIASKDDSKKNQERSAEPYFASENKSSSLMFVIDRGAAIFNRPGKIIEQVADWLKANVGALGTETEISFKTDDGWTLRGNFFAPDGMGAQKAPGVIFVHGQNHDAQAWYYLAQEVAKSGLPVLIFDRRANGKSVWEKGPTPEGSGNGNPLDVKAAINFMALQKSVDANRLALVSATALATAVIEVAVADSRVKTIVGMSLYGATDAAKQSIAKSDLPLFLMASTTDVNADGGSLADASRELHRLSKSKDTELIMYDDGGRGSNMPQVKPELTGMVVRWLNEKLEAKKESRP